MPMYCFHCKSCKFNFEVLCHYDERSKQKCPECKKKKNVESVIGQVHILGPTDSKRGNMEWAGPYNFEKAQKESAAAREQAAAKGLSPYRNIDDITGGNNFDPGEW
jgi:putative FmdB family regulatory protein